MQTDPTPDLYYQALNQYQAAQLLFEAIKLNIFSFLDKPATAAEIAAGMGCHEKNVELLLLALFSSGYIEKRDQHYCNTKEGAAYLSEASPYYLGKTILFRETMTSLCNIADQVRHGSKDFSGPWYDFSALAEVTVPEMYATGRVKSFAAEIKTIFPDASSQLKMLDLGGGSGVLAMEFSKNYPGSKAFVFETPDVADTTKRILSKHHMENRVSVLTGDFNTDDMGGPYDFIVASGILDFATGDLNRFMGKIASALTDGGCFLLIGKFPEAEGRPTENMVSWLSGYMNGIKPPPSKKQVEAALEQSRLQAVRLSQSGRFSGCFYKKAV
ncbi:methyltransferase [Lachnospiraceae bacterium 54-53]